MKYIVKNCPAYNDFCEEIKTYECKNIENCLLKRIVELCKKQKESCIFATAFIADEILKLLQIEEVNE